MSIPLCPASRGQTVAQTCYGRGLHRDAGELHDCLLGRAEGNTWKGETVRQNRKEREIPTKRMDEYLRTIFFFILKINYVF